MVGSSSRKTNDYGSVQVILALHALCHHKGTDIFIFATE
jgi:hypothetical protein